jgi:hypothetical protein
MQNEIVENCFCGGPYFSGIAKGLGGIMSKPRNVSNKSRRLQICLVLIASVVGISAIIFVACQERFVFILPGLVFLVACPVL